MESPAILEMNQYLFAWAMENLIKNAIDAMEGKGTITFHLEEKKPGVVSLEISDTGKGIPAGRHQSIFKPGFTTKKTNKTINHKIKKGEVLSIIANKYDVSVSQIKKANNLQSDYINYGKTLKIPTVVSVPI